PPDHPQPPLFPYTTLFRSAGGVYQFAYGANNNLASIVFPDNATRTYIYNEPANTGGVNLFTALTGIVDENGARFATFQYDAQERSEEHTSELQSPDHLVCR